MHTNGLMLYRFTHYWLTFSGKLQVGHSPNVGCPQLILELNVVYGIQGLKFWGWAGCGVCDRVCVVLTLYNICSLYVI